MFIPLPIIIVGLVILLAAAIWIVRRGGAGSANEISAPRSPTSLHDREADRLASKAMADNDPAPIIKGSEHRELTEEQRGALKEILRNGHKINAIKAAREMTGLDLAGAKDLVEALEADA